jgi:LPPG:FO 2-phospho-L-lactate transferase
MDGLAGFGVDTAFRLGDRDLALCLRRTNALRTGTSLSAFTREVSARLGVRAAVMPVSDDPVRTKIRVPAGDWLDFQEYFVARGHRDRVAELRYEGAPTARPAPGVTAAIREADVVVLAPSNPPLSIWPMLAVPGVREALDTARRVVAVSPLFGGRALKGPAADVMADLGLPPGNRGILAAYEGLLTDLVVDAVDAADAQGPPGPVSIHVADTHMEDAGAARRFAGELARILDPPAVSGRAGERR